jgi:acyl carrier protein
MASDTDVTARMDELGAIVESLRQHVVAVSGGQLTLADVVDDVDMYDAGYVDSVGVTEFMVRVSSQYQLAIPDVKLGTELKSLRDVARYIETALQAGARR